jgi:hypothetical protein
MSRISLNSNPSGTGTLSISSPNTNSDRTINLPDASGTVQLEGAAVNIGGNNISAVNSLGFRNRIINGDMRIDQRNAGASVSPSTSGGIEYSVDRFGGARPGSGVAFTLQQIADAPAGFVNSLRATVPTGATPSGTQLSFVAQPIEGLNVSDFGWGGANAQTITLSFWVKSSVTGSFPLVLVNSGNSRAYGATYTISAANTWEQKTVVVPGDTSGTWLTTNGMGIQVNWGLGGAGASRTVTTGWQTPSSPGSSVGVIAGTVNLVATTGATWQVTGVQLEAGSVATPFERRDYGRELMMCQRYYYKTLGVSNGSRLGVGYATATTTAEAILFFPSSMRVAPSSLEQSGTISDYGLRIPGVTIVCSSVPVFVSSNDTSANVLFTVASGLTSGQAIFGRSGSTNGFLAWSAEL